MHALLLILPAIHSAASAALPGQRAFCQSPGARTLLAERISMLRPRRRHK
jgi:hypothetical protein